MIAPARAGTPEAKGTFGTVKYSNFTLFALATYILASSIGFLTVGESILDGLIDETLVFILFALLLISALKKRSLDRTSVKLLLVAFAIFVWGGLSLWFNQAAAGASIWTLTSIAGLIDLKIYILTASIIALVGKDFKQIIRIYCYILVGLALVNLMFCIADLIRGTDIHGRALLSRAGYTIPNGIYDHKFKAAFAAVAGWISGLSLCSEFRSRISRVVLMALLTLAVMIVLSAKEILALVAVTIFHVSWHNAGPKQWLASIISIVLFSALLLTDNPISSAINDRVTTFNNVETVRTALYRQAPNVAFDNFPFGSGWGTFGSSASRDVWYSPLYSQYGIAKLWGGSHNDGVFLTDLFWAKIIAEQGFIGAILYLYLWFVAAKGAITIFRSRDDSMEARFSLYGAMALLILSLATPIYNYADGAILTAFTFTGLIFARGRGAMRRLASGTNPAIRPPPLLKVRT